MIEKEDNSIKENNATNIQTWAKRYKLLKHECARTDIHKKKNKSLYDLVFIFNQLMFKEGKIFFIYWILFIMKRKYVQYIKIITCIVKWEFNKKGCPFDIFSNNNKDMIS